MKDYYYILGVNKNASIQEIKEAYRKMSKKFHPDDNVGDAFFEQRFQEIKEAYEYLLNTYNYFNNENSSLVENESPQILTFESDKVFYSVGEKIKLNWFSKGGDVASISSIGNVELIGEKNILIKNSIKNFEIVMTVKNSFSSISKSIFIDILEENTNKIMKKNSSLKLNYWYFLIPIIFAIYVFKKTTVELYDDNYYYDMEIQTDTVLNASPELVESKIFYEYYSKDPMFNSDDIENIQLFNMPFNVIQGYYNLFINVDKVSKVKEYYWDTLLIHHDEEIISSTEAVQKDISNFKVDHIKSFRIFVQPDDMITNFYEKFDITSTSVNFYIQKNNGHLIKFRKRIYVILDKANTKLLGISSNEILSSNIEVIIKKYLHQVYESDEASEIDRYNQ